MNGQHRSVASYFITLAFVGRLYLVDSARLATSPEGSASRIELAGQMEEVFELDKTDAEKITPRPGRTASGISKILEGALVPLRPSFDEHGSLPLFTRVRRRRQRAEKPSRCSISPQIGH